MVKAFCWMLRTRVGKDGPLRERYSKAARSGGAIRPARKNGKIKHT